MSSRSVKDIVAQLADDENKEAEAKEAARVEAERRGKERAAKATAYKARVEERVVAPVHELVDEFEAEFKANKIMHAVSKEMKIIESPFDPKRQMEEGGQKQKAEIGRFRFMVKTGSAGPRWVHAGFVVETNVDRTDGEVLVCKGVGHDKIELAEHVRYPVSTFTKAAAHSAVDQIIELARSARATRG
jgi:hypothetical protein